MLIGVCKADSLQLKASGTKGRTEDGAKKDMRHET
jgi:hypothetical protein